MGVKPEPPPGRARRGARIPRTAAVAFALLLSLSGPSSGTSPGPPAAGPSGEPASLPAPSRAGLPPDTARWNDARTMRLVDRAIRARRHAWSDSSLRAFEARARGHVYYLAGMEGEGEPEGSSQIVRADQVALSVRWQAPDRAVQTIVGRRSEARLPSGIRYHIDHLTVVLANFGERIRMGEGTEVRDVLHPLAAEGPEHYDYRLADSMRIRDAEGETRLHRIEVRPKSSSTPGVVGAVHVEAASGAVARMRFTFTPPAYRDADLARIEVDLENARWEGGYWLPARQTTTIRRESSWLDFPLAGVIRTELTVGDYSINPDDDVQLPRGTRVATLPEPRLRTYDGWREGLYDGSAAREVETADAGELRARARELAQDRWLGGGRRWALHAPDLSSLFRVRRAEGALVGAGGRVRIDDERTARVWAGHPTEAGGVQGRVTLELPVGAGSLELQGYVDRFTDIGPFGAAGGLISTLGHLVGGEDFTDPYFRDGASADVSLPAGAWRLRAGVAWERHDSAALVAPPPGRGAARGTPDVRVGQLALLRAGASAPRDLLPGSRSRADLRLEAGLAGPGDYGFTRGLVELQSGSSGQEGPWGWSARVGLGVVAGDPPPQRLLLLGGRGTVPGYPFRGWVGDRAAHGGLDVWRELLGPRLRLRLLGAAAWAEVGGPGAAPAARLGLGGTGGVRGSLGAGLGFLDGALRLDVSRGLDGDGVWEWAISVAPRFRSML